MSMLIMDEYRLSPRRTLKPGCKVRVSHERDKYTYRCTSISTEGAYRSTSMDLRFRAFRPERIAKILRGVTLNGTTLTYRSK